MRHSQLPILVLAALVAGCTVPVQRELSTVPSSRTRLGPLRSEAGMRRPPAVAALDVTQLFAQRGFALVDQQATPGGGVVLRLKGARKTVDDLRFGSVFYVFIEPRADNFSRISIIGRATLHDHEVCTADAGYELGPCDRGLTASTYKIPGWGDLTGEPEAEVVHGVFSELRLQGLVPPLDPTVEHRDAEHARCLERRREVFDAARRIENERARANVIRTLPSCTS